MALLSGRIRCGPYKDKGKDQIQRHWILACARMTEEEKAGMTETEKAAPSSVAAPSRVKARDMPRGAACGPHEMRPLQRQGDGPNTTTLDPRLLMSRMTEGETAGMTEGETARMTEGETALLPGRMRCGPYKDKKKDQIQRITTRTNCKG